MLLIYHLVTWLYFLFVRVASHVDTKAQKLYHGQKNALKELRGWKKSGDKSPVVWIHAASLGEFEQGRPVIESLKTLAPDLKILLTFFSPSGYEVRKKYSLADQITYLPFDTAANAREFFAVVQPQLVILIKYEFWYHYIQTAHEAGIPVVSISTIFKPSQPFFRPYGSLHRKMLGWIEHFFVQNEQSKTLLASIGLKNATISGDTRYDRVIDISAVRPDLPIVEKFIGQEVVLVIGSSWPSDIDLIRSGLLKSIDRLKVIIAPHNISASEIADLLDSFPSAVRYSDADQTDLSKKRVLIIDNVGMLAALYGYADLAYVGGGVRGALHNTLEPATWGIPVMFAEHRKNSKFQEAIDLIDNGAAYAVSSAAGFEKQLQMLLEDTDKRQIAGAKARRQVENKAGATAIIMQYLTEKLDAQRKGH